MLRLRVFGGLVLEDESSGATGPITQPKALALLALAASAGERPVSRDKVLACLWPETEPGRAAHRLAQLVYALRHELRLDAVFRGSNDLRLSSRTIVSDVGEFTAALERGDLKRAITLYRGPFLDGFYLSGAAEFERWSEGERAGHRRKYCAALEALALADGRRGDTRGAAEWWRRLAETDPLNSEFAMACLEALNLSGGPASALQFARDHQRRLNEEFETEPDAAVIAAAERLRKSAVSKLAGNSQPTGPSIAVLPFLNLTPERENEYFSDGMTEELGNALARVPGLRVASRTSCFAFKNKEVDAREIAGRLGVSALVEGSVRTVGNRIRLNVQLVDAADGCDLWSQSYESTMEHVFTLQEELSHAIVAALRVGAGPPPPPRSRPTPQVDAYTLYLRGRYCVHKRSVEGLALAAEYFEQAVERDPSYALAHAGLAECWALQGFPEFGTLPALEAMPRAKAAAMEALRLDPGLPEGHLWLGVVQFLFDWDFPAAEEALRRALQLQPEHAYAETWYATFLSAMGRHDEARGRILHAQSLEPFSTSIRLCVARCHFFARRYQEALECIEGILRDEPGHLLTTIWGMRALCAEGRFAEALAAAEQVPLEHRTPYLRSATAQAYAGLAEREKARTICGELRQELRAGKQLSLLLVCAAYARLGDIDAALDAMEESLPRRDGEFAFILALPFYDLLRGRPRFEKLREDLHLPCESSSMEASSSS